MCDDSNECAQPADACASGWSVCGLAGVPDQISTRAKEAECSSAGGATGAYVSAMSHCVSFVSTCDYTAPYPCLPSGDCSEPMCCGPSCRNDLGCQDGLYPGATHAGGTFDAGCAALEATSVTGVLCCMD